MSRSSPRQTLHNLILQFFSDQEFMEFCSEYYPNVYNEFSDGMTKAQKVRMLLDYCISRGQWHLLISAIRAERPHLARELDALERTPPKPDEPPPWYLNGMLTITLGTLSVLGLVVWGLFYLRVRGFLEALHWPLGLFGLLAGLIVGGLALLARYKYPRTFQVVATKLAGRWALVAALTLCFTSISVVGGTFDHTLTTYCEYQGYQRPPDPKYPLHLGVIGGDGTKIGGQELVEGELERCCQSDSIRAWSISDQDGALCRDFFDYQVLLSVVEAPPNVLYEASIVNVTGPPVTSQREIHRNHECNHYAFLAYKVAKALAIPNTPDFYTPAPMRDPDDCVAYNALHEAVYLNHEGRKNGDREMQEQAVLKLKEIIDDDPDYTLAYYNKGVVLYQLGYYKDAIAALDIADEQVPGFFLTRAALAEAYYRYGQHKEAREMGESALGLATQSGTPKDQFVAHHILTNIALAIGNFEQAEDHIKAMDTLLHHDLDEEGLKQILYKSRGLLAYLQSNDNQNDIVDRRNARAWFKDAIHDQPGIYAEESLYYLAILEESDPGKACGAWSLYMQIGPPRTFGYEERKEDALKRQTSLRCTTSRLE